MRDTNIVLILLLHQLTFSDVKSVAQVEAKWLGVGAGGGVLRVAKQIF